ncbi:MAG: anti-sigma factor antagonist [Deltaproteobacteria bacterium]|nr:MAG: anti-sigma factor antagonist [Deltaproteobacteria bacterium]
MGEQSSIGIDRTGDIAVFDIKGDVTSASEPHFSEAYKHPDMDGVSKILLKFDEEAYINSGGIAVLIQLLAETKRNNQTVAITGLSEHFKKIFNMVGITRFATIYGSVEEAMGKL